MKAKPTQGIKAKSQLPMIRQISSHFLGSRASLWTGVAWDDKYYTLPMLPLFASIPPAFIAEHGVVWHGIAFSHLRFPPAPSLLVGK